MNTFLTKLKVKSWDWFKVRAHGTHAKIWLVFLSFGESVFLFITVDFFLAAILLAGSSRWIYYATITTAASVVGGVVGYGIGALFFDTLGIRIIDFYNLTDQLDHIGLLFDKNSFLVTIIAAFTPIPYKLFVLAGGFFKINFISFLVASIIGRGVRFFIVAYLVKQFGPHIFRAIFKYFNILTVLLVIFFVFYLLDSWGYINIPLL